jgi:hypothetical protein
VFPVVVTVTFVLLKLVLVVVLFDLKAGGVLMLTAVIRVILVRFIIVVNRQHRV